MLVAQGDTLSGRAQANNTTVDNLAAANNITDVNHIRLDKN
ncbi:MAG: LysM peptidoglycan-binding domain-containing protein [Janthinobacterium lividum]